MSTSSNKLKLRLELDVEYNLDGENPGELKAKLADVVRQAMGDGWITGDSPATVANYAFNVVDLTEKEAQLAELVDECEAAGVETIDLDDLVHDVSAHIGSDADNADLDGQIRLLTAQLGKAAGTVVRRVIQLKMEGRKDVGV